MKRFCFLILLAVLSYSAAAQLHYTTHWSKIESKPSLNLLSLGSREETLIDNNQLDIGWGFYLTEDSVWYLIGDEFRDSLYTGHSMYLKILKVYANFESSPEDLRHYDCEVTRDMRDQVNDAGEIIAVNEVFPDLAMKDTITCLMYLNDKIFELQKSRKNFKVHHYVFYDPEIQSSFDHLYKVKEE